jgi:hypothetical protein
MDILAACHVSQACMRLSHDYKCSEVHKPPCHTGAQWCSASWRWIPRTWLPSPPYLHNSISMIGNRIHTNTIIPKLCTWPVHAVQLPRLTELTRRTPLDLSAAFTAHIWLGASKADASLKTRLLSVACICALDQNTRIAHKWLQFLHELASQFGEDVIPALPELVPVCLKVNLTPPTRITPKFGDNKQFRLYNCVSVFWCFCTKRQSNFLSYIWY